MSDKSKIEKLIFHYAALIDAGDLVQAATLFDNGKLLGPEEVLLAQGYEQVLSFYQTTIKLYSCGTPKTRHVITNLVIDVDSDNASANAHSVFTVYQATQGLPLQVIMTGRYFDSFKYFQNEWRYVSKQYHSDLIGDLSYHLKIDFGG